jgi:hypothetical protein
MASPKFKEVIGELRDATDGGNLGWEGTADEESFRLGVSRGFIRVATWRNDDGARWYAVYLEDGNGQTIDELEGEDGSSNGYIARQLYESARRSALGADKLLDDILSKLKKK